MTTDPAKLRNMIREVAHEITRDPEIRRMIREVVIQTMIELEEVRKTGYVRSFLDACSARGIRMGWNPNTDKLTCNDQQLLTSELKAVLIVHRIEIVAFLRRQSDQDMAAEQRRKDYERQRAERKPNAAARP